MLVGQLKVFFSLIFLSFNRDFYLNESARGLRVLAKLFELSAGMKLVVLFQHNILLLEIL